MTPGSTLSGGRLIGGPPVQAAHYRIRAAYYIICGGIISLRIMPGGIV